jgi:type IV fimbrial biogenesis protein FimT
MMMTNRYIHRAKHAQNKGFTLVEFVIVGALVAILVGFAVPSFNNIIVSSRIASSVNEFIAGNAFARSEAITRKADIGLAPNQGTDWASGWVVFIDANFDGVRQPNEVILARGDAFPTGMTATDNSGAPGSPLVYVPGGTLRFNGAALGQRSIAIALKGQTKTLCIASTGSIRQC